MLVVLVLGGALLGLGSSAAYAAEALVGYWKFDEPVAGDAVMDSSGNGGTGTPVHDPMPSADVPPQITFLDPYSLSFNGSDQYVAVPDPANHRYTLTSGTFSTWVKFSGWTGGWQDFIAKRTTNGANVEYQWGYGTNSTGGNAMFKVTFASNGATGGNACCTDVDYTGTQLQLGTWYFVAMSFDATSHTLKWYVNGTLKQTDAIATNLGFGSNTGADLDIGSSYDGTGEFMDGELDDTRIYNYVLTDAQIAGMAAGQSGPNVNASGELTDPEPVTTATCSPAVWTVGSASCNIDASEEDVVSGDPDPPSISSVWWSTDAGATWSSVTGTSQTVALRAGTAVTSLEAYGVDSVGTQGSTVTATGYQDDTPPTAVLAMPAGSLTGESELSGTVSLPAITQTPGPPAVGIASAAIQYSPAARGQWQTACTIDDPAAGGSSCTWNTTQIANGSYDLREVATDTLGNVGTSPTVPNITVDNTVLSPPAPVAVTQTGPGSPGPPAPPVRTPKPVGPAHPVKAAHKAPIAAGIVTSKAFVGDSPNGGVFTLSAKGSRAAAGTTIRSYTWKVDGKPLGHTQTFTWAAPQANYAYRVVLAVRASNDTMSKVAFTLETVRRTRLATVHFAYNNPTLNASATHTLDDLSIAVWVSLHTHRGARAKITCAGYASASIYPLGAHDPANEALLSRERSQRVCMKLARTLASTETTLLSRWYGGSDPIATNFTPAGQAQNRRVTITASIAFNVVSVDAR